ncbi:hypothetical protein CR513_26540, partial [Mucuna pruriens]
MREESRLATPGKKIEHIKMLDFRSAIKKGGSLSERLRHLLRHKARSTNTQIFQKSSLTRQVATCWASDATRLEYNKVITIFIIRSLHPKPELVFDKMTNNKLPMEELLGTFNVHEIKLIKDEGQRKGKHIALKAQKASKESSSKAFKAKESCEEAFDEEGSNEDELSFISRKIHSMWKNKGGSRWKNNSRRYTKEVKDKSQVVYYKCKKPRHVRSECPSLEKEKGKEKKYLFLQGEERPHDHIGGP